MGAVDLDSNNVIHKLDFMDASHLQRLLHDQPRLLFVKYGGRSFLHHAILSGNLAIVKALLKHNGFSDEADGKGQTPLLAACQTGQLWTVDQLLAAGAREAIRDATGAGCVHKSAENGEIVVMQYLREVTGASLAEEDGSGRTPLMLAAAGGHPAAVRYLIEHARPSVLACDRCGDTALHHAARAGHVHICWLLVTIGSADLLTTANADGLMPHQVSAPPRSGCSRYLSALYRRQVTERTLPSVWPSRIWSLARPGVTYLAALLACRFTPAHWASLLNPLLMLAALLTMRGASHRLNHPSRLPSAFALGLVVALVVSSLLWTLSYMRTYQLVPAPVTALSACLLLGFVFWYWRTVKSDAGSLPPADDLAGALRTAAATPTGSQMYCPHCQVLLAEGDRHCRLCARCYRGYDHHCLYMDNCVAAASRQTYLQTLLLAAAASLAYLGHVWAYLQRMGPAGRWPILLLGSDIYTGSCVLAHVATLLFLRSLVFYEMRYLWRVLKGGCCTKMVKCFQYVFGKNVVGRVNIYTKC